MEKIGWTERAKNDEVLQKVEVRNILQTTKRGKANWIGHVLRRNCLRTHVIEGKAERRIEVTGRQERRRKHLLYDLKKRDDAVN
jgi:hypothetical protein